MAYKDTDYMYSSARVRALETKLLGAEQFARLIDAPTLSDAEALLSDAMPPVYDAEGNFDLEATLDAFLSEAFGLVESIAPDPSLFRFLRYEFDANNVKAAIKADFAGISADDMLFACGSVPAAAAAAAVRDKDFSAYPAHMAAAAAAAMEAFAATGDPQKIDLLLDRAAFADMLDAVRAEPLLLEIVRQKIDAANVLTMLRLIDAGQTGLAPEALLPLGNVPAETYLAAESRAELAGLLRYGPASGFAALLEAEPPMSFAALERAADEMQLSLIQKTRFVPFGLPVLCGYLLCALYQVKNLRIIFSLRALGSDGAAIRERMRNG